MAGCQMINSLGGFTLDEKMAQVAGKHACPIIIYHIKGIPKSMQQGEIHYTDVIAEITTFFEEQIAFGNKMGVTRKQFILDPGIGFGKTVEQNIAIINHLEEFAKLQLPLLLGFSRKSHVGMILQTELGLQDMPTPIERVEGSLAETALAVLNGATMIRTHDVLQTKRFLTVLERITKK
jgi:dihydropteroate synthase